jgi:hypothetical protein
MMISLPHVLMVEYTFSDSARQRSQDICPPISQIVLKNFIKISLFIKECKRCLLRQLSVYVLIFTQDNIYNQGTGMIQTYDHGLSCVSLGCYTDIALTNPR